MVVVVVVVLVPGFTEAVMVIRGGGDGCFGFGFDLLATLRDVRYITLERTVLGAFTHESLAMGARVDPGPELLHSALFRSRAQKDHLGPVDGV